MGFKIEVPVSFPRTGMTCLLKVCRVHCLPGNYPPAWARVYSAQDKMVDLVWGTTSRARFVLLISSASSTAT